jgi:hypothetical protein
MRRIWISLLLIFVLAGLVSAQDQDGADAPPMPTPNDDLTIAPIGYDQVVSDTITNKAIYDWWQLTASADDVIVIEMQAYEGLSPLIGILDPVQELVARSDDMRPSEPNTLAVVQYRPTTSGVFTIVATREGNQDGTTVGTYQLRIRKVNDIPERENELAPVEFRCDDKVATNALMVNFQDEIPDAMTDERQYREKYRLTLYGQDTFAPLILADADIVDTGRLDCNNDASAVLGNTYTLPGEAPVTLTETEQVHSAQLTLQNTSFTDTFGEMRFTLGSLDEGGGRFVVIIEGLELQDANDTDTLTLRSGPLAASVPLTVYVVGENPGRLDVSLQAYNQEYNLIAECDDAGRAACADVPSFVGSGATFLDGMFPFPSIVGDRFDAGVRLPSDTTQPMTIDISAGETGTHGHYTVFIIGELPAR